MPEHGDPVRLSAEDVAVIRGLSPYTAADDPATPHQVTIKPGQICRSGDSDGHQLVGVLAPSPVLVVFVPVGRGGTIATESAHGRAASTERAQFSPGPPRGER